MEKTDAVELAQVRAELELEQKKRIRTEQLLAQKLRELRRIETIHHQHERQLITQEKFASIGVLAAGLAHELNTPAGYIKCNLQLLLRNWQLLQQYHELLREDVAAATDFHQQHQLAFLLQDGTDLLDESLTGLNHIASIVKDLRLFADEHADLAGLVDLQECLRQSLEVLELEGATLPKVHHDSCAVPRFPGDSAKIQLAIMHLLNNACQAAGADGAISVQLMQPSEQWLELRIQDNGPGIASEMQDKIFDPFFTTRPVGQGRGMGLALVRIIMSQHQGEVMVDSTLGQGATFILRFPIIKQHHQL